MKRKQATEPTYVWRYPSNMGDLPGCLWNAGVLKPGDEATRPTPAQVDEHKLRAWFWCETCHQFRPTVEGYGGTGYTVNPGYGRDCKTDAVVCWKCCGEQDKQSMRETGRGMLYLTRRADAPKPERSLGTFERAPFLRAENYIASNWPASLVLPVMSIKRNAHNWHNVERVDFWFVFEGFVWHGIRLGDMDCARVRRTKTQWRKREGSDGFGPYTPRKSRAKVATAN